MVTIEQGYELYDLNYIPAQKLLRLFIEDEKTQSALIDDCVKVDRALSPYFEEEKWIPEEIVLEVSSPGVYRHISSTKHFEKAVGEIAQVTVFGTLPEQTLEMLPKSLQKQKVLRGQIQEVNDEGVFIQIEETNILLPFSNIKKANLDPEY